MSPAHMQHRGRSRIVSPVARARLASEERRQAIDADIDHRLMRAHRLRAREKLWEDEKTRLHDERRRALERRELDADQERRLHRATTSPPKREPDPFQYTFMQPSSSRPKCVKKSSHNRSVSFKEVITAMNGKLFPLDPSERADDARRIAGVPIAHPSPHKRRASVRADLLDSLLQVVEWQHGERRIAKGKGVDRTQSFKPSPTLSAASLSSSRSSSWLSFGSWRSTATDITTPDSPVLSPKDQPCVLPTLIQHQLCPRAAFVRISLEESPLCPPLISASSPFDDLSPSAPPPPIGLRGTLVMRVSRSVATIVEAARGIQSAYISATMFAAGNPYHVTRTPQHHRPSRSQQHTRPQGYRALAKDVQRFTATTAQISQSEPVHFIPLVSATAGTPKSTVPKDVILFPSPLRPRTPPSALAYRMRPIANPAVLRLKALQNVMCARGKEWEGRARDGALGCGKERILGIAFEGRGPSGLGCEVRFVVA